MCLNCVRPNDPILQYITLWRSKIPPTRNMVESLPTEERDGCKDVKDGGALTNSKGALSNRKPPAPASTLSTTFCALPNAGAAHASNVDDKAKDMTRCIPKEQVYCKRWSSIVPVSVTVSPPLAQPFVGIIWKILPDCTTSKSTEPPVETALRIFSVTGYVPCRATAITHSIMLFET